MLFPVYTTRQRNFALYVTGVIFTSKYFKFGLSTTGRSQSHFRNLSACSITVKTCICVGVLLRAGSKAWFNIYTYRSTRACWEANNRLPGMSMHNISCNRTAERMGAILRLLGKLFGLSLHSNLLLLVDSSFRNIWRRFVPMLEKNN